VQKMDKDQDMYVTQEELTNWILMSFRYTISCIKTHSFTRFLFFLFYTISFCYWICLLFDRLLDMFVV